MGSDADRRPHHHRSLSDTIIISKQGVCVDAVNINMQDDNKQQQQSPPRHFLLIDNPAKTTHLGTLLRCAAAFRAHQVLIVGHDKFNAQGSFGSHLYLDIVAFPSWECVVDYLKRGANEDGAHHDKITDAASAAHQTYTTDSSKDNRIPIVGISGAYGGDECIFSSDGVAVYEDADTGYATLSPTDAISSKEKKQKELPHKSYPIHTRPFSSDVCFLLSKDKRGLPVSHARICDSYVHVPQICFDADDSDTDAKLNTQEKIPRIIQSTLLETATIYSIVLHHFSAWANYNERSFAENQKFIKDTKSDMRRRLCRRYEENITTKTKDANNDLQTEDGLIFEPSEGVFASDY